MPEPTELAVASPLQILEGWVGGVMHADRPHAQALATLRAYALPADVDDPIFVTPDGPNRAMVWHRAREISSPRAMHDLQVYLHEQGLCLPPEVMFAWARTTERNQWAKEIRDTVNEVIAERIETAETLTDLWEWVTGELLRKAGVLIEGRDA